MSIMRKLGGYVLSRNIPTRSLLIGFLIGCVFATVCILYQSQSSMKRVKFSFTTTIPQHNKTIEIVNKSRETGTDFDSIACEAAKVADRLHRQIRIVCWVATTSKNVARRAAIMDTWGKGCQKLLFMVGSTVDKFKTSENLSSNAQIVQLNMTETYMKLWQKTKLAFSYAFEQNYQTDWIMKADDDTYVEMINLRLFLRSETDPERFWYGSRLNSDGGYNSGGSGYLLSSSVLKRFVEVGLRQNVCNSDLEGFEDQQMGICLRKLNITTGNTADRYGRLRFIPFKLELLLNPSLEKAKYEWFKAFSSEKLKEGLECCSDSAIGFHYISPVEMRILHYLSNQLSPVYSRRHQSDLNC